MTDLERFESRFVTEPMCGCWLWTGALDGHDYGHFWFGRKVIKAHRAAWLMLRGEIPHPMWVLHHCDTPQCVNPGHLFLGNRTANMRDMAAKGRQVFQANPLKVARGERAGNAVLKDGDVIVIRQLLKQGRTGRSIARQYGICTATVSQIRRRVTWTHLLDSAAATMQ